MKKMHSDDLLLYWKPETADDVLKREDALDHVASNQLKRASAGDVIWVVTVYDGELVLLGRLIVDTVTDRTGAINRLRRKDVWGNMKCYALARPGKEEPLMRISLRDQAKKLGFVASKAKNAHLTIDHRNRTNPQQLQTMRILDNASAQLLEQVWKQG
jgi:site-specific recombinase